MAASADFRMNYNHLPLFDLTPYDKVQPLVYSKDEDEDADKFASAYDALANYNIFANRLKDPAKFRTESEEEPTRENLYTAFQAAICAIREENLENIVGEINSIDVSKIHGFAKKHFDALNTIANKFKTQLAPKS